MDKITNNIWLGDASDVVTSSSLEEHNITAIVNVANEQIINSDNLNIKFFKFGLSDSNNNTKSIVKLIIDLIHILKVEEKRNILVLCSCGINRSPAILAEYLAKYEYTYYTSAIDSIKAIRPSVNTNFRLYDRKKEVFTFGDMKNESKN